MNAPATLSRAGDPDAIVTRLAPAEAGSTWNAETRQVEAVIATNGAGVRRWDERGTYVELLDPAGMEAIDSVVLLDAHRRESMAHVIGRADRLRPTRSDVRARLTLSPHNTTAQTLASELGDGARFGVSIGYVVLAWAEQTDPKTGARTKTATRWQLREVSIVPVPADPKASTRSDPMPPEVDTPANPAPTPPPPPPATPSVERSAPPAPAVVDRAAVNREIRSIATLSGLGRDWADAQIDAGADVEGTRAAAFAEMQRRGGPAESVRSAPRVEMGTDWTDPAHRVRAAGEAVFARYTPGHAPSEPARRFMGMTTLDLARECLTARGTPVSGLSAATIVERALHSTSDFPAILGEGIGRTMREAYRAAPSGLKQTGRRTTARDFKAKHSLQLDGPAQLEKVNEHGEFKSGTLRESVSSYALETRGLIIGVTRQAIVNDDLGAFADMGRRFGVTAAATEAKILVQLILANAGAGPTMSDGSPLFHASHANVSAGAALAVEALGEARKAMRKQTGLAGDLIDVAPRFLLVPPDLETTGEKVLTQLAPTRPDDVNPFAGKLVLVVEPRFTDAGRWYVAADPATVDGLEYAYLEGEEGVVVETKAGFEVDGVQIKGRLDFGAGFVDWRSWHMNPGA
ncbi:prohead protease/major capsid protein fusion protein [Salinarimonas chemoclinalis]|uniref:prohead protease/major capsid protein fusion protein n=1 Tax=Salinarimonas chemoclinalis TaxID=3241599 RepID=UPI003555CB0F